VRTAIIEDQLFTREILRKVCTAELGFEVVAEESDGSVAIGQILRTKAELVLLDLELLGLDGFTVADLVRKAGLRPRILVFSSFLDDYTIYRVERSMVHGFMDKNFNDAAALAEAIRAVAQGEARFSNAFVKARAARHADPMAFDKLLSDREIAVLSMIGDLLNDHQIAERLNIADRTAQKHRFNIQAKLGLGSPRALLHYAQDRGFTQSVVRVSR
jgi:DNA-binding NarL/FixJ family response regulator